jgi:hypothetical protein
MKTIKKLVQIGALVAGGLLTASNAHAAYNGVCTPDMTSFDDISFAVHCTQTNNWYFAFNTGNDSGCQPLKNDTLKTWMSLSEAAILSGKNLSINATDQGGCQGVVWMQLNKN